MMAITDEYVAYCFDEAVSEWGNWIRGELDKIDGNNAKQIQARQQAVLMKLLKGDVKERFRVPVATATKEELAERGIEV